MKKPQVATQPAQERMKVLFLESHGLRSPLTTIRWACGRLKKEAPQSLSLRQQSLVERIHGNVIMLSTALESMLLIAKVEEGQHLKRREELCIGDILSRREAWGIPAALKVHIHCPHLHFMGDRQIVETIFKDIFTIFVDYDQETSPMVLIEISSQDGVLSCAFRSSFLLPVLHHHEASETGEGGETMVGGIPGLMLSMAHDLAKTINGTVELEEVITGEFVTDGTVELAPNDADEHRIVFRLPASTVVKEGLCGSRTGK